MNWKGLPIFGAVVAFVTWVVGDAEKFPGSIGSKEPNRRPRPTRKKYDKRTDTKEESKP